VCGGCCEISSDDDGHNEEGHCRSCKKYMYMKGGPNCVPVSSLDHYCMNCVEYCQLCGYGDVVDDYNSNISPKDVEKYKVPLDAAIVEIIYSYDSVVAVLGEDAYDGEDVYLCKKCHNNINGRSIQREVNHSRDLQRSRLNLNLVLVGHCQQRVSDVIMYDNGMMVN